MPITISFDPQDADDVAKILEIIGENAAVEDAPAPAPAAKTKTKAKAAPEPDPEPEPEDGVTLEQCVERAQELVAEGRSADVKGALANFEVKRVSELDEAQYEEFLAALNEESVV